MAKRRGKKKTKKVINNNVIEIKRRSPVAHTTILRKGGAHQQSRSGERQKQKRSLHKALADHGGSRKSGDRKGDEQSSFIMILAPLA
jgi:hypothetical protein